MTTVSPFEAEGAVDHLGRVQGQQDPVQFLAPGGAGP